jgi:arylsulfatase A-like enzyme
MKKGGVKWLVVVWILIFGGTHSYGEQNRDDPPNIIFIMADDLGFGDLGCYGQEHIQTPHIDHLARTGTRFTNAYAGAPVCAPSRSVLMTGQHTGHTRVRGNSGYTGGAPDEMTGAGGRCYRC